MNHHKKSRFQILTPFAWLGASIIINANGRKLKSVDFSKRGRSSFFHAVMQKIEIIKNKKYNDLQSHRSRMLCKKN